MEAAKPFMPGRGDILLVAHLFVRLQVLSLQIIRPYNLRMHTAGISGTRFETLATWQGEVSDRLWELAVSLIQGSMNDANHG